MSKDNECANCGESARAHRDEDGNDGGCGGGRMGFVSERQRERELENATCAQLENDDEHECGGPLVPGECSLCDRQIRGVYTCDDCENNRALLCKRCEATMRADVEQTRVNRA
jgi:hypothetical protein